MAYWKGFLKQRGVCSFVRLLWRKSISWVVSFRFAKCQHLMLGGSYQISGYKFISIGKLSAGARFRMEAIGFFYEEDFQPELTIGDKVSFGDDIHIGCVSQLTIGSNVLCGSNIVILDHDHGCYGRSNAPHSSPTEPPASRKLAAAPIKIGNNVHIGEYVVILKGVEIGDGAVIGAGSVVTRSIGANSLAVGNPAKVVKRFDFGEKRWVNLITELPRK